VREFGMQTINEKEQRARITISVTGMTCASCVRRVERVLTNVPGVLEASGNLASERATVECLAGEVEPRELEKAVESAGYGVIREDERSSVEDSHEREYRKLRTDFSTQRRLRR
jgi:P-type Cu+ transporter